jgi:hypothetical protein
MKKMILLLFAIASFLIDVNAQEYKIITTVESIVPAGIGRSRMIENHSEQNAADLTTTRTDGKTSDQKNVKRKRAKVDNFSETKLLNFYSLAGINFQNVASNDAIVADRLSKLSKEGWELVFVTSGVESDGGETDSNGIFITRYIFKRSNKGFTKPETK